MVPNARGTRDLMSTGYEMKTQNIGSVVTRGAEPRSWDAAMGAQGTTNGQFSQGLDWYRSEVSSGSQFPPVIARRAQKCPHAYGQKQGGRDKTYRLRNLSPKDLISIRKSVKSPNTAILTGKFRYYSASSQQTAGRKAYQLGKTKSTLFLNV